MRNLLKNNKGQFVIVAAILIAVLTFSLAFSVHQTNSQRQELRYIPVQELVLGITSDLERSLDCAINVSSHTYKATRDSSASNISGSGFMSTWARSVLTAYANAAMNVTILSTDFHFTGWSSSTGTSYGTSYFSLDAPSYGFQGWIGHSQRSVTLTLYPLEHGINQHTRNESDEVEFCLTQSKTQGYLPIPNLETEDLTVQNHITGSVWDAAQIKKLEYLGAGNYSVTFSPGLNPSSLGVILTVSTPDEGILVEAKYYEPLVPVTLKSQLLGSENATNEGRIQFGDSTYFLPEAVDTQVGTYILRYFPNTNYTLDHWAAEGSATLSNAMSNPTLVEVQDACNITAFYKPGSSNQTYNETYTVTLRSQAWDGSSLNLGNITFASTTYSLPTTLMNIQPQDYSLEYGIYNSTYIFHSWLAEGDALPWNSTDSSTTVSIAGNGTITAVYGPAPFTGYGNTLYVDAGYRLATDPELSDKWYKGGQGDHLPSTSSTGYNKQEVVMQSSPTKVVYVMSYASITTYVRPTPPSSAKTVTMEFGFFYGGKYYGLGTGSYPVNVAGMYNMIVQATGGNWTSEYGQGVIPIGSIIQLKVIVEFTEGNGFFFILYGVDQESRIEFG